MPQKPKQNMLPSAPRTAARALEGLRSMLGRGCVGDKTGYTCMPWLPWPSHATLRKSHLVSGGPAGWANSQDPTGSGPCQCAADWIMIPFD